MSNYTKSTNFATKDNLPTGDPLKIVKGTEIDTEFNNIATAVSTKTDNASAAITGGSITGITDLAIADGGTGASTATAAINNLLPSQTSNANKYLQTDGTNVSWDAISINTGDITGTLPVANGGTGVTSSTGTGSVVLSNSPTLVTPSLGAATASTLDVSGNVTLSGGTANTIPYLNGSKVVTTGAELYFNGTNLGVGASASYRVDLGSATSDDAAVGIRIGRGGSSTTWSLIDNVGGSGNYRQYSSGTPTLRWLTSTNGTSWSEQMRLNATGLGVGNNNPTEKLDVTGSALVSGSVTASQFYGSFNGAIGNTTAYSGAFTSLTTSSTVTINGGTANGVAYLNGSKVLTTGSVIKFDGTNFTSDRSASTAYSGTDYTTYPNGFILQNSATPATGLFNSIYFKNNANMQNVFGVAQNSSGYGDFVWAGYAGTYTEWMKLTSSGLTLTSNPTLSGGTANGVTYLNGSKVLTSGSALTFDGTTFGVNSSSNGATLINTGSTGSATNQNMTLNHSPGGGAYAYTAIQIAGIDTFSAGGSLSSYSGNAIINAPSASIIFKNATTEGMRLTSTGLGIGTSNPQTRLVVSNGSNENIEFFSGSVALNGGGFEYINRTTATTRPDFNYYLGINGAHKFYISGSEQMRLNSTGLGIGTSSPSVKLQVTTATASSSIDTNSTMIGVGGTADATSALRLIGFGYKANTYYPTYIGAVQTSNAGNTYSDLVFYTRSVTTDTAPTERMRLDTSGNLGLGVTPSAWSGFVGLQVGALGGLNLGGSVDDNFVGSNVYYNSNWYFARPTTATYASMYRQTGGQHRFYTSSATGTAGNAITWTQAMTLDASGNLGVGTSSPTSASGYKFLTISDAGGANGAVFESISTGVTSRFFSRSSDGTSNIGTFSNHPFTFATNSSERARIDTSGNLLVNATSTTGQHTIAGRTATDGTLFLSLSGTTAAQCAYFYYVNSGDPNAANAAMKVWQNTTTSRSINAKGTINASGADYAEYMTKASDFSAAKGDVVGVDANGKLTNVFADAVSFVVKSTNPSYVGGDTWGDEDAIGKRPEENAPQSEKDAFNAKLEAARQTVDRIAFAGQVPVNVIGATAGQYIVPVNDNGAIKGVAKNEADLTMSDYIKSVGKVIAIEADGRAKIIVKVA